MCEAGPVVADVDVGDLRAARDLAASLARDAGALQMRERPEVTASRGARVTSEAHANDLVSDVDRAGEELVVDGLRAAFPDDGVPAALHLAYLASGRLDCGAPVGAKLWDVAAGLLLAREAGVVLGGADDLPAPALILAAAPGLSGAFFACDAAHRLVAHGGGSPGGPRAAGVA